MATISHHNEIPHNSYLDHRLVNRLRSFRGWSVRKMGKVCGIAFGHLSRLLRQQTPICDLKGDTIERIAHGLQVPLVCLITTPGDPRWLPIDFSQPGKVSEIMGELADASCIMTVGNALDCYLLPSQMSLSFSEAEYRTWGLDEERVVEEMRLKALYEQIRRVTRRNKDYLLQVVGPDSVLHWARHCNIAWLDFIAAQLKDRHSRDLTTLGLIPSCNWRTLVGDVRLLQPYREWIKINLSDTCAVVWHRCGAIYSYESQTIDQLRDKLQQIAMANAPHEFVTWNGDRKKALLNHTRQGMAEFLDRFGATYHSKPKRELKEADLSFDFPTSLLHMRFGGDGV